MYIFKELIQINKQFNNIDMIDHLLIKMHKQLEQMPYN